jgi:hypothetical protein
MNMSDGAQKRNGWPSGTELVAREVHVTSADRLQGQIDVLQRRLDAVEREHKQCETRFADLQDQNTNLIQLAVASQLLSAATEREDVLGAIEEIVLNMIGSEEIAIFELRQDGLSLALVRSRGVDGPSARLELGLERIKQAAASGSIVLKSMLQPIDADGGFTAAIPLKLEGAVLGIVAIFRLLDQKPALEPVDHELFELLSRQAALALYCTNFRSTRPTVKPPRK